MSNFYARYLESFSIPPNILRYGTAITALMVISCFFTIAIGNAIYDPFNFMDHAYISTAAKNFANNLGYSVAFESPASGLKQFEPAITTGPTLVIPAALLIRAALSHIDSANGQAFNIGGGMQNSLSLIELFHFLEKLLDIKIDFQRLPERQSDQFVFVADTDKASRLLGWAPQVSMEEGIRGMVEWIQSPDFRM